MDNKNWIFDGHEDIAFNSLHCTGKDFFLENKLEGLSLRTEPQLNQSDYQRLSKSGVKIIQGVIFPYRFSEHSELISSEEIGREETFRQLDFYLKLEEKHPALIRILRTQADLKYVLETEGMLGILLLIEDAIGLGEDLSDLDDLHEKGVRIIGPVWNKDNQFGGGTETDSGLTPLGKDLLKKMESMGIALDTAHMNKKDFTDALESFEGVTINSHTGAFGINEHRRNLTDDQLYALKERGGVIGVAFVPEFLAKDKKRAGVLEVVAHLKYMVSVIGADNVAFGSDFDGMSWPNCSLGLRDAAEFNNLVLEIEREFSSQDCEKIRYKNWLRILKQILK